MLRGTLRRLILAGAAAGAVLAGVAAGAIELSRGSAAGPPYGTPLNQDGRTGSDQRAVAYRVTSSGPVRIRVASRELPHSRLFYTGWGGWEPSIGVNRRGDIFYGSYSTNLTPIVLRSTDGGRRWTNVIAPVFKFSLDPYLWVDPSTGRIFDTNLQPSVTCPPIAFSDTAGASWQTGAVCGDFDHETIFAGPAPRGDAQPSGYPHVVYYCAINGVATAGGSTFTSCTKSLDGGQNWTPTGAAPYPPRVVPSWPGGICDGGVGHIVVGPDGTLYVPRAWCGPTYLAISHDEGATWTRVRITNRPSLSIPRDGDHETGVAVDSAGNLYYTWVAADHHVYLSVFRDDGRRWSAPLDIQPPGVPWMSAFTTEVVAGAPGNIALLYVGTGHRGTPNAHTAWNAYLMESTSALQRHPVFDAVPLNDPKTNPLWRGDATSCGDLRCGNMGDFLDLVIGPTGQPWASLVDGCPGKANRCVPDCGSLDNSCPNTPSTSTPRGEAAVGTVVGGPDLAASPRRRRELSPPLASTPPSAHRISPRAPPR